MTRLFSSVIELTVTPCMPEIMMIEIMTRLPTNNHNSVAMPAFENVSRLSRRSAR